MVFLLLATSAFAQADGWSKLKGKDPIDVYRDARGIPHVFAKSVDDAMWAQGWLQGEDRLFQMEKFRRAAKGESAEVFGRDGLANDLDRRRRGYTEAERQAMFDRASDRFRGVVTSYCAGVNAYIKEGKLPPAFEEQKIVPRAWVPTDCVAVAIMMARRFGESGELEVQLVQAFDVLKNLAGEDEAKLMLDDLARIPDPLAPTTLDDQQVPAKDERHDWVEPPPAMGREWERDYFAELDAIRTSRDVLGVPNYFGSNAWVIGAKKSASGRPMLYGGPMMGFGTPSICAQAHLSAPGLEVGGMAFPGIPGIMIGFNSRIAWTTTTGGADLVDVFVLELNPENPLEYRYKGEWKKLEVFETTVKIAGEEDKTIAVYRSVYGPLLGDRDLKKHRAQSVKMSFWMREVDSFEAMLDLNLAASVADAGKAVSKITTSHNWFAADRDGHIGFWFSGMHPIRKKGHDQRFPQKGDGSMDWEGFLPFEKWPQSVDPANGFFANWNNKPTRTWEPFGLGQVFWGKRIADAIRPKEKVSFDDVAALAHEAAYYDFLADYFLPYMLEVADEETSKKLKAWDRIKRDGAVEPAMVEKWCDVLVAKVFGNALGPMVAMKDLRKILVSPLLYIVQQGKYGVALKHEWVSRGELAKAMKDAMAKALKAEPWEESEVNFKGNAGKVKSEKGRGTFQMAVEMTPDGPRAMTLSAPGQSERADSKHVADQVDGFKAWTYTAFPWRREDMK